MLCKIVVHAMSMLNSLEQCTQKKNKICFSFSSLEKCFAFIRQTHKHVLYYTSVQIKINFGVELFE